jgi:hypothetical protein
VECACEDAGWAAVGVSTDSKVAIPSATKGSSPFNKENWSIWITPFLSAYSFMEEKATALLLNSKPAFYIDRRGIVLGI